MKIEKELFKGSNVAEIYKKLRQSVLPNIDYDDASFKTYDETLQTFVLVTSMHGQVCNGGFISFIDNSTGDYFHETVEALDKIRASQIVETLNKCALYFPDSRVPKEMQKRRDIIDTLHKKYTIKGEEYDMVDKEWEDFWGNLDQAYYNNLDFVPHKLIEYLKANAELID